MLAVPVVAFSRMFADLIGYTRPTGTGWVAPAVGTVLFLFWWELALLVVIMLLGHWLEMRALGQASTALDALAAVLPDTAERIRDDGQVETIPAAELHVGDLVLVRSGARVPADGVIEDGDAHFDESLITGESRPVHHRPGDKVVAASSAGGSALVAVREDPRCSPFECPVPLTARSGLGALHHGSPARAGVRRVAR